MNEPSASLKRPTSSESPALRSTLAALVDTLLPALPPDAHGSRYPSGTEAGIDRAIFELTQGLALEDRTDFDRLLRTIDSPALNLLLTGRPVRFRQLSPAARERYLSGWANSRLAIKRRGFSAVKRLALGEYFGGPVVGAPHPLWSRIHYAPPPPPALSRDPLEGLDPMHVDADVETTADVCIVGSGAGAAVIADRVTRSGYSTTVLEAGDWWVHREYPRVEREARNRLFAGRGLVTTRDGAIGILAGATVGGGTSINWMTCLPPRPEAREEWATIAGLEGVDGPQFDQELARVAARIKVSTHESRVNPNNDALRRGCVHLGYRQGVDWDIIPRNAVGCEARCGFCTFGCPYAARQSGPVTFLHDALRGGARLYARTRADLIEITEGRATGVRATYVDGSGAHRVRVRARAVVVAAGALETPTLLMRSGVRHPGVGVGLRLDPTTALAAEFPDPVRTWEGPHQTIGVYRFQTLDAGAHGPWIEAAPAHPGLSALALPWAGAQDFRRLMERTEYVATPIVLVRDVGEGKVTLDREGRPRYDYELTPLDRDHLVRGMVETARILWAAGATRLLSLQTPYVEVGDGRGNLTSNDLDRFVTEVKRIGVRPNAIALFSAHPIGSARAGRNPRSSATDPRGRVHGIERLWVGDGSLLPSAPGANPMLSILAVASRTADHLVAELARD